MYTTKKSELAAIKKEVSALESLGFNCEFETKTGLPFEIEGAICFKNQAQFHPLKYLYGLASCVIKNNGEILLILLLQMCKKKVPLMLYLLENM